MDQDTNTLHIEAIKELLTHKKFVLAEAKCKEILDRDSNNLDASFYLFDAVLGQKKFDELIEISFTIFAMTEDEDIFALTWEHLYFEKENEKSLSYCDEILTKFVDFERAKLWKGMTYNQMGNIEKGFEVWNDIPSDHPRYLDVLNNSGLIYEELGHIDEAKKYYSSVIDSDIDANKAKAYASVNLGNLLKESNPKSAIPHYEKATFYSEQGEFDFPAAYFHLGDTYFKIGKYTMASDYLQKSIEINPSNIDAYLQLMNCFNRLGDKKSMLRVKRRGIDNAKKYNLDLSQLQNIE